MLPARSFLVLLPVLLTAAPALAQPPEEPIGWYVADVRGSIVPFPRNEELAGARGLRAPDTPGAGLGFDIGAHVYPFRLWIVTFGIGASVHSSAASQAPAEFSPMPDGPPIRKEFTAISPQLSFNFGNRDGWSYLSGGIGRSRLSLYAEGSGAPEQRTANTLNYGGGVRWFTSDHLAFTIDARFYAISPLVQMDEVPASPRMTQMTLNVGVSFR